MLSFKLTAPAVALFSLFSLVAGAPKPPAPPPNPATSLTSQLLQAETAIDRYNLLADKDFLFDFNTAPFPLANRKFFPALVGTGMSVALAHVPGCNFAALHLHPRSAEIFVVLEGHILTEMILETGVNDPATGQLRSVRLDMKANTTTVFPQGALHMQFNPECEPAFALAAFASEDAGASLVVPGAFALSDADVVRSFGTTLTEEDVRRIRGGIPGAPIFEVAACKKRCGIAE